MLSEADARMAQQVRKAHGPAIDNVSILEEVRGAIVEYRLLLSRTLSSGRLA